MQKLLKRLRSDCVITTVGDVMIDQWLYGSNQRESCEFGKRVDIIDIDREVISCGGAANAARHVVSLGAKSNLIGAVGDDMWGYEFDRLCQRDDIIFLQTVDLSRPTTIKTRVISEEGDCCTRFDRESRKSVFGLVESKIENDVSCQTHSTDVFIVSDYGKGIITQGIIEQLVETGKPVVVDLKYHAEGKYNGVTLLKPNDVDITLEQMLKLSEIAPTVSTKGEHGMEMFREGEFAKHLDGWKVPVKDAVGAGDAVIAGIAVAIASGLNLFDSMKIGNLAGAVSVMEEGTLTGITLEKMEKVACEF